MTGPIPRTLFVYKRAGLDTQKSGYLEYGRCGETVMYAHTPDDFVQAIRWLGEDGDLRTRLERIADRYRDFLRGL